jgi:UDP-N-acetylmuramoyl-L-alanyl-D-glutamate--2,6-diaminopimelate ligase
MGAAAVALADLAILTSDNPRSEDPLAILAEMLQGVLTVPAGQRGRLIIEPDRAAAIGLAIAGAGKGDIVVVAGKGHERGQYVAGAVIPFDDREVAADALAGLASADLASTGPDSALPAEPPIEQSLIEQGLIRPNRPGRQEDA